VVGERSNECVVRARRARHDEQPTGLSVEAVHDARAVRVTRRHEIGELCEEPVDERSAGVAGTRVHHESRGLRNHHDVFVDVPHVDRHRLRVRMRVDRGPREELDDLAPD